MKFRPVVVLVAAALWSVDTSSAFVQQSAGGLVAPIVTLYPAGTSVATTTTTTATTVCHASSMDGGGDGIGSSRTSFPYDDDAIRFAYDEWRLIYGKGDYDRFRFENFKTNYKTLTMANIQARNKAVQQGQAAPQWMSLNEYGDYSVAEYEAMLEGRLIGETGRTTASSTNGDSDYSSSYQYSNGVNGGGEQQDQFGRPVRSTQVVQPSGGTQVVSSGGAPRGTQVIQSSNRLQDQAGQPPAYDTSMSYGGFGGEEYQDQFGRTIRPTQVLQSSVTPSTNYGTQVIQSSAPRGTQVVSSSSTYNSGSGVRGTQVIQSNVASSSPSYGTQVVNPAGSSGQGTRVIKPTDTPDRGTLVISKNDDKENWSKYSNDLPTGDYKDDGKSPVTKRGTMVIKRQIPEPEPGFNPFDLFGPKTSEKRETVQIDPKSTKDVSTSDNGFFSFFNGKKEEETLKGTQPLVQDTKPKEQKASVFSFFGGKQQTDDSRSVRGTIILKNPGTKKTLEIEKRRKTVLIPKKQSENGLPSILSFFGGAKKVSEDEAARNPNARPTLLIKKPKKTTPSWSLFSSPTKKTEEIPKALASTSNMVNDRIEAQLAKQREAIENATKRKAQMMEERETKRKEMQKKREEATQRRVAQAQGKGPKSNRPLITALGQPILPQKKNTPTIKPPVMKPQLSFFGSAQVPEVRRWRQNFDGSISGLIYKSRSFDDGTRVTTSPVPRGAKKGTIVTTKGGTKYFLQ